MKLCIVACLLAAAVAWDPDYELVWEDNFNTLDLENNWDHEVTAWGGGNGEFQVYTDDKTNSFVKDGKLFIQPTLLRDNINPLTGQPFGDAFLSSGILNLWDMYGRCTMEENGGCYRVGEPDAIINPIASARLRSYQRFSFQYGRVEVRAKMPVGDWFWPAIWMLPEDWKYGGWPLSGEMDLVESRGNRDFKCNNEDLGIQHAGSTMHWGVSPDQNRYYLTGEIIHDYEQNFGDFFHNYTLDWSANGLRFMIDGKDVMKVPDPQIDQNPQWQGFHTFGAPWYDPNFNPWTNGQNPLMTPFDEKFHLILNIAAGGTNFFFPEGCSNQGGAANKPWSNSQSERQAMTSFWNARGQWYDQSWAPEGDNNAMQVDYIKVYQAV